MGSICKASLEVREKNFIKKLGEKTDKFEYISGYEYAKSWVKLKCKKCRGVNEYFSGYIYNKSPIVCKECECVDINDVYRNRINEMDDFEYLGYEKSNRASNNKVIIKCKECGSIYKYSHYHVLNNVIKICCSKNTTMKRSYETYARTIAKDIIYNSCGNLKDSINREIDYRLKTTYGKKFDEVQLREAVDKALKEIMYGNKDI